MGDEINIYEKTASEKVHGQKKEQVAVQLLD